MRFFIAVMILISSLLSEELKVTADKFSADQQKGISIFKGNVHIIKSEDEIKASHIVINTNKENQPTKIDAKGSVKFKITTEDGSKYKGKADEIIYLPQKKEYKFFGNVHLQQLDTKKEIIGDRVALNTIDGKAVAEGIETKPVVMIFTIPDKKDDKKEEN